jgi:hypothetical protein
MKTHFLKHPIRRRISGWQWVLQALRSLFNSYHSAKFGG